MIKFLRAFFTILFTMSLFCSSVFAEESISFEGDMSDEDMVDLIELEMLLFTEIPEVESTGFFKVKKSKAPGYSTVIAASTIENSPVRTMADLIETFVPGATINKHESHGSLIGMRGMAIDNNSKTLVMVDGHSVSARNGAGYANQLDVPLLGDMAKVEVINGPGAIVHGSGAISGFINMIPKTGKDFPGWYAKATLGEGDGVYTTELGYGKNYSEDTDLYVYVGMVDGKGVKANNEWDYETNYYIEDEIQVGPDPWGNPGPDTYGWPSDGSGPIIYDYYEHDQSLNNHNKHKLMVKGFSDPSYKAMINFKHKDFSLKAYFTETHTLYNTVYGREGFIDWDGGFWTNIIGHPGGGVWYSGYLVNTAGFNSQAYHTMTASVMPSYKINITDTESIEIKGAMDWMHHWLDNDQCSGWDGYCTSTRVGGRESNSELKVIGRTQRIENLSFALGGSMGRREFESGKVWFHTPLDGGSAVEDATLHEYALFSEAVWDITEKFLFSAGVRYDQVTYSPIKTLDNTTLPDSQDNTSHRLAMSYAFDDDTSVKLSYQEGFRVPEMAHYTEVNYFNNILRANGATELPGLDIEEMSSTEINFHKKLKDLNLSFDLNAYYNEYSKTLFWRNFARENNGVIIDTATVDNVVNTWADVNTGTGDPAGWFGAMVNAPGKFRSVGAELIAKWSPIDTMNLTFIYDYSTPLDVAPEVNSVMFLADNAKSAWIAYPTHRFRLSLVNFWLKEKLMTNLVYQYTSSYPVGKTDKLHWIYAQPRSIVDAALAYNFTDKLSAKLVVKNLFDSNVPHMTNYGDPNTGSFGDERRYWYFGMKYDY